MDEFLAVLEQGLEDALGEEVGELVMQCILHGLPRQDFGTFSGKTSKLTQQKGLNPHP